MRVPGTIEKHLPEHQAHVCRFLGIPLHEYEDWLASYNIVHWRTFNDFLMELRETIEESKRNKHQVTVSLGEALKLYGIEDWALTLPQQEYLTESTNEMLEMHDLNWFLENYESLVEELEEAFMRIGETQPQYAE